MPRLPQSHNKTTPLEKFDNTAYDAVELVAQNIDDVIRAADGVDVMALYLGASDTEPTTGNDGAPLVSGNFYLDTTTSSLKYWDGENSVWVVSDVDTVVNAATDAQAARDAAQAAQTAAETAETNSATSASNSASSATAASTSASNASVSESNAATSANNAANSETAAAQSESNASTSETNAAASESAASTSETNASASESAAAASAVSAAASANAAEAAFDNFDDKYLGAKTVPPTTDNDGQPLEVGASYWHDNGDDTGELNFWNGATWESPDATASQAAQAAVAARDDAQLSETNAGLSEAAALASANAAGVDANNAGNSATAAANSAATATTKAQEALDSEQAANASEINAATSETNAGVSETNAAASAAAAAASAGDVTWKVHTRGEAEMKSMREQHKAVRAASGFDHYGWHDGAVGAQTVNEGMSTNSAASSWAYRLGMGRIASSPNNAGTSELPYAMTAIAGFISELRNINLNSTNTDSFIKFPEAPNGTVTYNSVTGAQVQHVDAATAFAYADANADTEVVIDRHDVFGGTFSLEEVSLAYPYVYPKGVIQSQATTMNGLTTVATNRPDTYYSVFDGDTPFIRSPEFNQSGNRRGFIPTWRPVGTGSTIKCKVRWDNPVWGFILSKGSGSTGNNFYIGLNNGVNVYSVGCSQLLIDGQNALNTGFAPVFGQEYTLEATLDDGVVVDWISGYTTASGYTHDGRIWDVELTDNTDPTNSRFYPVIETRDDGSLSGTVLEQATYSHESTSDLAASGWQAGNEYTLAGDTFTSTGTSVGGAILINAGVKLGGEYTLEYDFTTVTTSNTTLQIRNAGGGSGASLPFTSLGDAVVGTQRHTGTWTFTPDDTGGFTGFYIRTANRSVGDTIQIHSWKVKSADGQLVNFPVGEEWVRESGVPNGGSAGLGVDFWAASDQEKIAMVSDASNNIFMLDDGRVVQWRMRQRTVAGAGNGDWLAIDTTKTTGSLRFSAQSPVMSRGVLNDAPDYSDSSNDNTFRSFIASANAHPEQGVFTVINTASPSRGVDDECYFHVWGVVPRLNQGAFHPSFNPMGAKLFLDSTGAWDKWHLVTDGYVNSTLDCFTKSLDDSGNIGGHGSGRDDGRKYDAIYAGGQGGVTDHRLSAWDMGSKEEAAKVFQKVVNGTYRGKEGVPLTVFVDSIDSEGSTSSSIFWDGNENPGGLTAADCIKGTAIAAVYEDGSSAHLGFVGYSLSDQALRVVNAENEEISVVRTSNRYMLTFESNYSVSGEFAMTDVIGDPANILATPDLANGWIGGWIPVIPNGASQLFKYTRKALTNQRETTWTDDNGTSWSNGSFTLDTTKNGVQGTLPTGRIEVNTYTAFAKQTKESTNKVVLNGSEGLGDVFATSSFEVGTGCSLIETLIGKVGTSNTVRWSSSSMTETHINPSNGAMESHSAYAGKHNPIGINAPNNDSPAVKALWYQTSDNQQLGLNFVYNELVWNAGGTVGNEWGDTVAATTYINAYGTIKIVDGQTTDTNLNGDTILIGINELSIPYGYSRNQARAGQQTNGVDL